MLDYTYGAIECNIDLLERSSKEAQLILQQIASSGRGKRVFPNLPGNQKTRKKIFPFPSWRKHQRFRLSQKRVLFVVLCHMSKQCIHVMTGYNGAVDIKLKIGWKNFPGSFEVFQGKLRKNPVTSFP